VVGWEEAAIALARLLVMVTVTTVLAFSGCASLTSPLSDSPMVPSADSLPVDASSSFTDPGILAAMPEGHAPPPTKGDAPKQSGAQQQLPAGSVPPASVAGDEAEPYDPFATQAPAAEEDYDPWEPFNSKMFELNRKLDRYLIKPAAQVYDKIMPDELERGLSNSFHNIRFVPRLINNLLQGKFKGAGLELGRFVINSTFGLAGFMDFAGEVFGMQTFDEDTGQTLGAWGIPAGPYLVLPLYPPLTVRDAFGTVGDFLLDPINYFLFAVVRVGQPALVFHQNTATFGYMGMRAGEIVNERSINLEKFQGVEEATVDLYSAVRNAYLQRRAKDIRE
jgi:phospholipid-binding lipoprotein MlaA